MSVLLTGAAGFIGSHVADRLLKNGEEVVALDLFDDFYSPRLKEENLRQARDHDAFALVRGDVRDGELLRSLPGTIDAIVHLAARAGVRPSIERPLLYTDVNVRGTAELLAFAKDREIRPFVFASSSSVYGNNEKVPFSETDPVDRPISPYAATKRAGELLCHTASHLDGLWVICLRLFTVYGPRQRPDLAIRKFSRLLLAGEPLPRFGDGTTARDYTFCEDILQGMGAALAWARGVGGAIAGGGTAASGTGGSSRTAERPDGSGRYEIVNLGESRTITLEEMIRVVGEVFGRKPKVRALPLQPGDVACTYTDVTKARELLGFRPKTDFEAGMRIFAEWYLTDGARQDGVA